MQHIFYRWLWVSGCLGFSLIHSIPGGAAPIPVPGIPFVGKAATEAVLEFDHWIDFRFDVSNPPGENGEILLLAAARNQIEKQLTYLFGPMYANKEEQSAPKKDHVLTDLKPSLQPGTSNRYRVFYHYRGTIVIKNRSERNFDFSIPLPTEPDRIFHQSIVYKDLEGELSAAGLETKATYPCFSEDAMVADYDEKYFWYFWDPDMPGCPLVEGRDYFRVAGKVRMRQNTEKTYPQYPDLVQKGEISVSVFVGMDNSDNSRDPRSSKDDAASSFQIYQNWLLRNQFKKVSFLKARFWRYLQQKGSGFSWTRYLLKRPYTIEEYVKKVNGIRVWVRLIFSPTGMIEDSDAFWHLFRDAIENHSMMIYDGHSGLGVDLSIAGLNIRGDYVLRPDPDRYQLYHFDACDSYSYYNNKYFVLKGGTKNLDIVTNGLITDMDFEGPDGEKKKVALLQSVYDWTSGERAWSFQEIVNVIDSDNLLGVNGDEDNPTERPAFPTK